MAGVRVTGAVKRKRTLWHLHVRLEYASRDPFCSQRQTVIYLSGCASIDVPRPSCSDRTLFGRVCLRYRGKADSSSCFVS